MSDHQNVSVLTIQSLFQSDQSIRIPSYQRAYSWEALLHKAILTGLYRNIISK